MKNVSIHYSCHTFPLPTLGDSSPHRKAALRLFYSAWSTLYNDLAYPLVIFFFFFWRCWLGAGASCEKHPSNASLYNPHLIRKVSTHHTDTPANFNLSSLLTFTPLPPVPQQIVTRRKDDCIELHLYFIHLYKFMACYW